MDNCEQCGLPIFAGPAGYVGPMCMCRWRSTAPHVSEEVESLRARIAQLEAELATLREYKRKCEEQEPYGFMLDDDKTFERFRRTYHSGPEWTPLYTKEPK